MFEAYPVYERKTG